MCLSVLRLERTRLHFPESSELSVMEIEQRIGGLPVVMFHPTPCPLTWDWYLVPLVWWSRVVFQRFVLMATIACPPLVSSLSRRACCPASSAHTWARSHLLSPDGGALSAPALDTEKVIHSLAPYTGSVLAVFTQLALHLSACSVSLCAFLCLVQSCVAIACS